MRRALGLLAVVGAGVALASQVNAYLKGRREISQHVADYRVHWEERVDGGAEALHYVALGDSAAQGVGASKVDRGYVPAVARRLAQATGREVVVTNLSVSGATSADVLRDQVPLLQALPITPDLVTLDVGGNDVVFPGHTPSSFEANLDRILEELPQGSYVADVPWLVVPPLGRNSQQMAERASVLIDQHNHHLVPLHRIMREAGALTFRRYTAGDWFHPNDLGYEGWTDAFWDAIEASGVVETFRRAHAHPG